MFNQEQYRKEWKERNKDKIKKDAKKYYQKNKRRILERTKQYRERNPDKVRETRKQYWQAHRKEHLAENRKRGKEWYAKNREMVREHVRQRKLINREKVIKYYSHGTNACRCCGEKEPKFLTVDHINGGGRKERLSTRRTGVDFYAWLIRNNYPNGFQILCMNCNFAKGDLGTCPHQANRKG